VSSVIVQLPLSVLVTWPEALAVPLIVPPLIVVVPEPGVKKLMRLVSLALVYEPLPVYDHEVDPLVEPLPEPPSGFHAPELVMSKLLTPASLKCLLPLSLMAPPPVTAPEAVKLPEPE
jgi:hypothetical protein